RSRPTGRDAAAWRTHHSTPEPCRGTARNVGDHGNRTTVDGARPARRVPVHTATRRRSPRLGHVHVRWCELSAERAGEHRPIAPSLPEGEHHNVRRWVLDERRQLRAYDGEPPVG